MENRKLRRKPASIPFEYGVADAGTGFRAGRMLDHNTRGIRFEAQERLPVGTRLQLRFDAVDPAEGDFPSGAEGMVVWSIQPDPGKPLFRVGLKYI